MEPEIILRYAVKGLNDTMEPNGLVSSLLVFGFMPIFHMDNKANPIHNTIMKMTELERDKLLKIRTEQRIATALGTNIPPSAKYTIKAGDEVLTYSERERKWIPNPRVVVVYGKHVCINTGKRIVNLHIVMILPDITFDDDWEVISLLKAMSIFSTGGPSRILIIEVLKPNDPKGLSARFDEARAHKIYGLLKRRAFGIVLEKDVPNQRILREVDLCLL